MKIYNIGFGDFFGKNTPNNKFNKELIPFLKKLGINKEKDLDKIAEIVSEIYSIGYSNGSDNREKEIMENEFLT